MQEYIIDPEFDRLLWPLSPMELRDLEENIVNDGRVLNPIIVWGNVIVDGKHRYLIAKKHNLPFVVEALAFADREAVIDWIISNQLGRRNIDQMQMNVLRQTVLQRRGSASLAASELKVTKRTVERSRETMNALEAMPEDLRAQCKAGGIVAHGATLRAYGNLSPVERQGVDNKLRANPQQGLQGAMPKAVRHTLSKEDVAYLEQCQALDAVVRRRFLDGNIGASGVELAKFKALPSAKQALVNDVFQVTDKSALGEVLEIVEKGVPNKTKTPKSALSINEKIQKAIDQLLVAFGDLGRAYNDASCRDYEDCIAAVKHLNGVWRGWTRRYS